jgi:hypothetical protein
MMNQMGQWMRFGAKFQKNYPWSSWWLTARNGCLQRNLIALAYVQTRLPLELYSTYLPNNWIWHPMNSGLVLTTFWVDEKIKDNDSCKCSFCNIYFSQGWLGDNCWQPRFTQLMSQSISCNTREIRCNYHYPLVTAGLAWVWYLDAGNCLLSAVSVGIPYAFCHCRFHEPLIHIRLG